MAFPGVVGPLPFALLVGVVVPLRVVKGLEGVVVGFAVGLRVGFLFALVGLRWGVLCVNIVVHVVCDGAVDNAWVCGVVWCGVCDAVGGGSCVVECGWKWGEGDDNVR